MRSSFAILMHVESIATPFLKKISLMGRSLRNLPLNPAYNSYRYDSLVSIAKSREKIETKKMYSAKCFIQ